MYLVRPEMKDGRRELEEVGSRVSRLGKLRPTPFGSSVSDSLND